MHSTGRVTTLCVFAAGLACINNVKEYLRTQGEKEREEKIVSSAARKAGLGRYIYVSSGHVGSRQKASPAFCVRESLVSRCAF